MDLYVGGLKYSTTEATIREALGAGGRRPIESVRIIRDRMTGQSRGYAFVAFEDEDDARAAMAAWDDQELDGRTVRVSEARTQVRVQRRYE